MKFLKEPDFVSVVTSIAGLVALVWHIHNYVQGARLTVFSPDQVTIGSSEKVKFPNRDGGPYMHIVGRLSYANKGAVGYNAVVQRERLEISLPNGEIYEHRWHRFVTSDATGPDGTTLLIEKQRDASPFPLNAGSSESHSTLFQPWPKSCAKNQPKCRRDHNYLDWDEFVRIFSTTRSLRLRFRVDVFGIDKPIETTCTVQMSEANFQRMKNRKWGSPICSRSDKTH